MKEVMIGRQGRRGPWDGAGSNRKIAHRVTVILAAALGLGACDDTAGLADASAAKATPSGAAAGLPACENGEARLPLTGLCVSQAVKYLNMAGGKPPEAPEEANGACEWRVQETQFATDVLLYRALRCGGKTTKLVYKAGAGLGELSYETAAWGDPEGLLNGQVLVKVGGADLSNSSSTVLATARAAIDDPAERRNCSVRKADLEFWPDDALVVDVSADEAAQQEPPRGKVCGAYGYDGGGSSFWRVFQGYAWYFDLGQDPWQIDPGSFTLMTKLSSGVWSQAN